MRLTAFEARPTIESRRRENNFKKTAQPGVRASARNALTWLRARSMRAEITISFQRESHVLVAFQERNARCKHM